MAKLSGKGARAKGMRAESEIEKIGNELGVVTQRVLASGAQKGAEGDIKIGVFLNEDGTVPERDESNSIFRGEVKNRAIHPDYIFEELEKPSPDLPYKDMQQSPATKVLAWRRRKIPGTALADKDYNRCWMMMMGATDFFLLLKSYMELKTENARLRSALIDAQIGKDR